MKMEVTGSMDSCWFVPWLWLQGAPLIVRLPKDMVVTVEVGSRGLDEHRPSHRSRSRATSGRIVALRC